MLRELLKYVPVVPLAGALLLFVLMPFDEPPADRAKGGEASVRSVAAH